MSTQLGIWINDIHPGVPGLVYGLIFLDVSHLLGPPHPTQMSTYVKNTTGGFGLGSSRLI
eukprot:1156108-Pelagomonas_calceolata.AAC.4